jgi:hypothetical protein
MCEPRVWWGWALAGVLACLEIDEREWAEKLAESEE